MIQFSFFGWTTPLNTLISCNCIRYKISDQIWKLLVSKFFLGSLYTYTQRNVWGAAVPAMHWTQWQAGAGLAGMCSSPADWLSAATVSSLWGEWWFGCPRTERNWRHLCSGPSHGSAFAAMCLLAPGQSHLDNENQTHISLAWHTSLDGTTFMISK